MFACPFVLFICLSKHLPQKWVFLRSCTTAARCVRVCALLPSETTPRSTVLFNHITTEVSSSSCFNKHGFSFQCSNPFLWASFQQGNYEFRHLGKHQAKLVGCFVMALQMSTQLRQVKCTGNPRVCSGVSVAMTQCEESHQKVSFICMIFVPPLII